MTVIKVTAVITVIKVIQVIKRLYKLYITYISYKSYHTVIYNIHPKTSGSRFFRPGTLGHRQIRAAALAAVLHQAVSVPEVLQALQLAAAPGAAATHAYGRELGWDEL